MTQPAQSPHAGDFSDHLPPRRWFITRLDLERPATWSPREFCLASEDFSRLAVAAVTGFADPISEQWIMPDSVQLLDALWRWQLAIHIAADVLEAAERAFHASRNDGESPFDRINAIRTTALELEQFAQAFDEDALMPTRRELADRFESVAEPLRNCAARLHVIFASEAELAGHSPRRSSHG